MPVLENWTRTTASSQRSMSEENSSLVERRLVWSARLAAADEGINRALADAVDRHATKDPEMRGIYIY